MAGIAQPTLTSALGCGHLRPLVHRRAVWLLLLIVSLTVVGLGMLQRNAASVVTVPTPLPTAYGDFISPTSDQLQLLPVQSSTDGRPGLDAPPPFDEALCFLQLTSGRMQPIVTNTPPPADDAFLPFRGATE